MDDNSLTKERLICLAGWGQKGKVLQSLAGMFSDYAQVELTSVYELLFRDRVEQSNQEDACPPSGVSPYARQLHQMISAREVPTALLAWSMGSLAALEVAASPPENLSKIVLISGTASYCLRPEAQGDYRWGIPRSRLRAMRLGLKRLPEETLFRFFQDCLGHGAKTGLIREKTHEALELDRHLLEHGLNYLENSDLRVAIGNIKRPVFLIHGLEDSIIPPEAGRYLCRHIQGSTIQLIEGATHAICEQNPELVAETVQRFLQS